MVPAGHGMRGQSECRLAARNRMTVHRSSSPVRPTVLLMLAVVPAFLALEQVLADSGRVAPRAAIVLPMIGAFVVAWWIGRRASVAVAAVVLLASVGLLTAVALWS